MSRTVRVPTSTKGTNAKILMKALKHILTFLVRFSGESPQISGESPQTCGESPQIGHQGQKYVEMFDHQG